MARSTAFSLLLPVYARDDPAHLSRSFASAVDDQELPPAEVVVVRDGPVPADLAALLDALVAQSRVPVRLVELAENAGLAAALTAGLQACTHEIVARQDADDVSMPARFARQLAALEGGLDLVGSAIAEFADDEDVVLGVRTPPLTEAAIRAYAPFHSPFNHPTVVFRKSVVAAAGGYQPVGTMEDYWLWVRMLQAGARVANLPDPLVKYRVGAGAYRRRGGIALLKTELALQRLLRDTGFTTRAQLVRNVAVRGTYRLLPEGLRRVSYRRLLHPRFSRSKP